MNRFVYTILYSELTRADASGEAAAAGRWDSRSSHSHSVQTTVLYTIYTSRLRRLASSQSLRTMHLSLAMSGPMNLACIPSGSAFAMVGWRLEPRAWCLVRRAAGGWTLLHGRNLAV